MSIYKKIDDEYDHIKRMRRINRILNDNRESVGDNVGAINHLCDGEYGQIRAGIDSLSEMTPNEFAQFERYINDTND